MMWDLPLSVEINGNEYVIRNKCDYRVVLDVIAALNDEDLEMQHRLQCALLIFYENDIVEDDVEFAIIEMFKIINLGEELVEEETPKPQVMDWQHDFNHIAPPISRVLGYSVRDKNHYTHWYDFIGAYMEIGECTFSSIVSIRNKKLTGKKLEKWEQDFYRENRKIIDLPLKLTKEEQELLDSNW